VQAFYIPSESMEPTLHGCPGCNGDRVLVNKLAWRLRDPARGEIVVFIAEHDTTGHRSFLSRVKSFLTEGLGVTTPRETDFIKRIIGLPGETVQVTDNGVYITPVHGKRFKLSEPYIARPSSTGKLVPCGTSTSCPEGKTQAPIKVPPKSYFVMGDNRENSADSRFRTPPWIKRSDFVGKAFVKIWPVGRISLVHVPSYGAKASATGGSQSAPALPLAAVVLGIGAVVRRKTS